MFVLIFLGHFCVSLMFLFAMYDAHLREQEEGDEPKSKKKRLFAGACVSFNPNVRNA